MAIEIFSGTFFSGIVLPFLLIFTVVFAILIKSSILSARPDINAIVALAFGLLVIGVPAAIGVITKIIPIIAVFVVIILSWMLLMGFIGTTNKEGGLPKGLKTTLNIIISIAVVAAIVWATGLLDTIQAGPMVGEIINYVILIAAVIAVIAIITSPPAAPPK